MKKGGSIIVTLKSVAKYAGVSKATAARILGGYGGPRSKARDKVLKAAEELGYFPNKLARSLASKKSYKIGVIIPDIENLYFAKMYRGIEDICHKDGYTLVLGISGEDSEREGQLLKDLLSEQVEGIVIAPTNGLKRIPYSSLPIICVDRIPEGAKKKYSWISTNNYESSILAVKHLAEQGFKNLSLIVNLPHLSTTKERLSGVQDAVKSTGLHLSTLITASYQLERIVPEIIEFLQANQSDAVLVTDTVICTAVVMATRELGIELGADLGLITFDDEPWMSLIEPSITAIKQPVYEMGQIAAQTLLDQLIVKEKTIIEKRLANHIIIRGSTFKVKSS